MTPRVSSTTFGGDGAVGRHGQTLGRREDFRIDLRSGNEGYAVMSFEGALGIGYELFAGPWSALRVDTAETRFVLDAPKDMREREPEFAPDRWTDLAHRERSAAAEKYGGAPPRPRLDSD